MRILATLCALLLVCWTALAQQPALSGLVIDRYSGEQLQGAMVVLVGTTRGASTDANGRYTIPLELTDRPPLTLRFSAIGYATAERQTTGADTVDVALTPMQDVADCVFPSLRPMLWLWSGLRYAPVGVMAKVYAERYLPLPLSATLGYQTNLRRNRQWLAELAWERSFRLPSSYYLESRLRHSHIQVNPLGFQFTSYQLRASVSSSKPGRPHWLPTLWLGTGWARQRAENASRQGVGYELGLEKSFWRTGISAQATATHWPGYWQWQGGIQRRFGWLNTRLDATKIGRYAELSLGAGITL